MSKLSRKKVIVLLGPTAVGKTRLSLLLAERYQAEIVSCDARQFYRGLDIGTAKPSQGELAKIPHHFINHLDPTQSYNAARYAVEAEKLIRARLQEKEVLLMVGGSTLYVEAWWYGIDEMPPVKPEVRAQLQARLQQEGLEVLGRELARVDPETYARVDRQNPVRVIRALEVYHSTGKPISYFRQGKKALPKPYQQINLALTDERDALYARINQRVLDMVESGLVSEVQRLLAQGLAPDSQALTSIGYQEIIAHLQGKYDLARAVELIQRNSRRYAKRQLTWFRRYPDLRWFQAHESKQLIAYVEEQIRA